MFENLAKYVAGRRTRTSFSLCHILAKIVNQERAASTKKQVKEWVKSNVARRGEDPILWSVGGNVVWGKA